MGIADRDYYRERGAPRPTLTPALSRQAGEGVGQNSRVGGNDGGERPPTDSLSRLTGEGRRAGSRFRGSNRKRMAPLALAVAAAAAVVATLLLTAGCSGADDAAPTSSAPEAMPIAGSTQEPASGDGDGSESEAESTPTPHPTSTPVEESGGTGGAVGDRAPEFVGVNRWLNSEPLTMEGLRGSVVLVDFWTYTCVNCIRTLPYLRDWHAKYAERGLSLIGVHTPEFEYEKVTENVISASEELAVVWPVAQDNDFRTWRAYDNRYWPAKYLIDANGVVRYTKFGEGSYDETERLIRELLEEAGADVSDIAVNPDRGPEADRRAYEADSIEDRQTREIYGGWNRNSSPTGLYIAHPQYYDGRSLTQFYRDPGIHLNQFMYLNGSWRTGDESIIHARATESLDDWIALRFLARTVNIVVGFPEGTEPFEVDVFIADLPPADADPGVELDYRPLAPDEAGEHIVLEGGRSYFVVNEPDLYNAVALPAFGAAEVKFASNSPDFALFALTFGSYDEVY